MIFKEAKWIWYKKDAGKDEYSDFFVEFKASSFREMICRISCDGDYTLYINGSYIASNQYGDFEHYKVYDEIDIASLAVNGINTFSVTVWHPGKNSSRYKEAAAGLIFEIVADGAVIASSSEATLARLSPTYESGRCGVITAQLGYGFHYDARYDDKSLFSGKGFSNAALIDKKCIFHPRIAKKLCFGKKKIPASVTENDCCRHFLIDLGEETVGLLHLRFFSDLSQRLRIDWGENLENGHVRRILDSRTFSVEYTAAQGENNYTNYMLRFGCRFIEVWAEYPIKLEYAGIIPEYYPIKENEGRPISPQDKKIYELCLNTLKLCMMEHYVDCPWREQALYAYDSRNQMLAGYYAFEGGNAEYALSNLKLISMDRRPGGLLSICYPTGKTLAIPSFSLHYVIAVYEYYEHTGDKRFLSEVYPKLTEIADSFANRIKDGLVQNVKSKDIWNFYDWSKFLDGIKGGEMPEEYDSVINMLYVIALEKLEIISCILGKGFTYRGTAEKIRDNVRKNFFSEGDGLFSFGIEKSEYTELANSLAIISKTIDSETAKSICEKMTEGATCESSLSMKCFMYDALLMTDKSYKEYILRDIRKKYGYMLSCGATAAWETINGASDFDNAGSLCHGWSAMPIYYYHKFGMIR